MPELPEVETTINGIKPYVLKQTILKAIIRQPQLRWPISANTADALKGKQIQNVSRRGKYILIQTNHGTILIHLGMSGRLSIMPVASSPGKHDHIDIQVNEQNLLRYTDPRRFGAFLWLNSPSILHHPLLRNLGIEPFDSDFDGDYLLQKAVKKTLAIKSFIMDQRIVVGVGNIYATEALFMANIHPATPSKLISIDQMHDLTYAIKNLLKDAIQAGGTSLKDFLNVNGNPGYFKFHLQIYDRQGQPCPECDTTIEKIIINQRSSCFCPSCQI